MTAQHSLTNEKRTLALSDINGYPVRFQIDSQGDLNIEDEDYTEIYIYREDLPTLRDWLNKVLSPNYCSHCDKFVDGGPCTYPDKKFCENTR